MKKHTPGTRSIRNSELMVFELILKDCNPTQIKKILKEKLTKNQVDYAVECLKDNGFINMTSHGVWEAIVPKLPESIRKKTHHGTKAHTQEFGKKTKEKIVRGHGYQMTVKLPKIMGWEGREKLLVKKNIKFLPIVQGQRISVDDIEKVWLCHNRSVVLYMGGHSFFADTALNSAWSAMNYAINIIKKMERMLGLPYGSFMYDRRGYRIKFDLMHHALIRNALAKQYDREKKKLFIYDEEGLWLIIDNSFQLHELEAPRTKDSIPVTNLMHRWGNELKDTQLTPKTTLGLINKTQTQLNDLTGKLDFYAQNQVTHTGYIKTSGIATNALKDVVAELKDTVKGLVVKEDISQKAEAFEEYTVRKLRIIKDTGQIMALIPDVDRTLKSKWVEFKMGAIVSLECMTAYALMKSGFAEEMKG